MSVERYAHEYLYEDGSVHNGRNPDKGWIVESYIMENDGYSFMSRGSQRRLVVRVAHGTNPQILSDAVENTEISETVQEMLQEMMDEGKLGVRDRSL